MCSTCCTLGVGGEYREHQCPVTTGEVSRMSGRLGGESKIKLK